MRIRHSNLNRTLRSVAFVVLGIMAIGFGTACDERDFGVVSGVESLMDSSPNADAKMPEASSADAKQKPDGKSEQSGELTLDLSLVFAD